MRWKKVLINHKLWGPGLFIPGNTEHKLITAGAPPCVAGRARSVTTHTHCQGSEADQSNAPSNSLCRQQHVFPRVQLVGVGVLPVQVLAHRLGGELRLTDIAEVPRQVDGFTWGGGAGRRVLWLQCKQQGASSLDLHSLGCEGLRYGWYAFLLHLN